MPRPAVCAERIITSVVKSMFGTSPLEYTSAQPMMKKPIAMTISRLHDFHQAADDRNENDDDHAARRQDQPRPGRGVAEHALRELGNDHGAGVEDAAHGGDHQRNRRLKFLSLKTSRLTIGFLATSSHSTAPTIPRKASKRQRDDEGRAEPIVVLAAIHHDLQAAEPDRDEGKTDVVDAAARLVLLPRRILDQDPIGENREDSRPAY